MIERRTVAELVCIYELEPSLRDVFVEGPSDVSLLRWFCQEHGIRNAAIYDIDSIHIPGSLSATGGARQRTITLAAQLSAGMASPTSQATCVVDSDLDAFLSAGISYPSLLYTDFTSFEMYLFDAKVLAKFLSLVLRLHISAEVVLDQIYPILKELFLLRVANHLLKLNLQGFACDRCLSFKDGRLLFDRQEYVQRYMNKNNRLNQVNEVETVVENFRAIAEGDPRFHVHGHDFLDVLEWYVRNLGTQSTKDTKALVQKSLWGCLDAAHLSTFTLFVVLVSRLS